MNENFEHDIENANVETACEFSYKQWRSGTEVGECSTPMNLLLVELDGTPYFSCLACANRYAAELKTWS